ncbi:hypothetical protein BASA81_016872 [Batrachochytrium salamandrivorans]|nr:hypothetical protein BASA81_016872 [Batrachochytrium salamandrivorans]
MKASILTVFSLLVASCSAVRIPQSNSDASTEPQASNSEGQQPHDSIGSHSGNDDTTGQESSRSGEGAISGAESPDGESSSKKEDAGFVKLSGSIKLSGSGKLSGKLSGPDGDRWYSLQDVLQNIDYRNREPQPDPKSDIDDYIDKCYSDEYDPDEGCSYEGQDTDDLFETPNGETDTKQSSSNSDPYEDGPNKDQDINFFFL